MVESGLSTAFDTSYANVFAGIRARKKRDQELWDKLLENGQITPKQYQLGRDGKIGLPDTLQTPYKYDPETQKEILKNMSPEPGLYEQGPDGRLRRIPDPNTAGQTQPTHMRFVAGAQKKSDPNEVVTIDKAMSDLDQALRDNLPPTLATRARRRQLDAAATAQDRATRRLM